MTAFDVDRLLDLVWEMDLDVNMCLAGAITQSQLVSRILHTCRRIREKAPDAPTDYSIQAIERDARDIVHPFPHARGDLDEAAATASTDSELMKDLFNLRAHLSKSRASVH